MELRFGLYPRFYARRKDLLLPLIEKYYGQPVKGLSHGRTIQIYFNLLRSVPEFRAEIDAVIAQNERKLLTGQEKKLLKKKRSSDLQYNDAIGDWRIWNIFRSEENKIPPNEKLDIEPAITNKISSGGVTVGTNPLSAIAGAIGSIFGFAEAKVSANAADDKAFYEIVLAEQKKDDTIKVLIVSGIAIAFIGIMAYVVIKTRKAGG